MKSMGLPSSVNRCKRLLRRSATTRTGAAPRVSTQMPCGSLSCPGSEESVGIDAFEADEDACYSGSARLLDEVGQAVTHGVDLDQQADRDAIHLAQLGEPVEDRLPFPIAREVVIGDEEALRVRPDYAEAHWNWGNALRSVGRLEQGVAQYQRAVQLKPNYAEAYNSLGNILRMLGRSEDALAQYRKALAAKPDYVDACVNLGPSLQWVLDGFGDGSFGSDSAVRRRQIDGRRQRLFLYRANE